MGIKQGTLFLDDFWRCIRYVLQLGGRKEGGAEWEEASLLAGHIHQAFEDSDGTVDFAAITSGVSILCQSSLDEKVRQCMPERGILQEHVLLIEVLIVAWVFSSVNPDRAIDSCRGMDELGFVVFITAVSRSTPPDAPAIQQILVALTLFDTDADGKLTFEEVTTYMASVLRVVCAVSEGEMGESGRYV